MLHTREAKRLPYNDFIIFPLAAGRIICAKHNIIYAKRKHHYPKGNIIALHRR